MMVLFAMYLVGVAVGRYIDTRRRTRLGLALQQEALKRIAAHRRVSGHGKEPRQPSARYA